MPEQLSTVHYIPLLTTLISLIFSLVLLNRYRVRGGTHHLWWSMGVLAYGLGTALEGAVTLFGNTVILTKAWYVAGALLGGYPLAQGSVYLHYTKKTAHLLTALTLPFIAIFSVLVFLSPANTQALESFRPSGAVLGWQWIRAFTPLINTYAVIFLIGTAAWSAWYFSRVPNGWNRSLGNALIAFGALLPGIGGVMAKAGAVEGLYVGEFLGIIFIWIGYAFCVRVPVEAGSAVTGLRSAA